MRFTQPLTYKYITNFLDAGDGLFKITDHGMIGNGPWRPADK